MSLWMCQGCKSLTAFKASMRCSCGGALEFATIETAAYPEVELFTTDTEVEAFIDAADESRRHDRDRAEVEALRSQLTEAQRRAEAAEARLVAQGEEIARLQQTIALKDAAIELALLKVEAITEPKPHA